MNLLISFMTCIDCKETQRISQDRRCTYCGGKLSARDDDIWPEEAARRKAKIVADFERWEETHE